MSEVLLSFRGREIRVGDVAFLRELIAQNPTLSRRALSAKACEAWNWVQPNGQPRDMICRSLMLKLHRAGHIELPAPRFVAINNAIRHRRVRVFENLDTSPLECSLRELGTLEIQQVRRRDGEDLFHHLIKEYHHPIHLMESFVDIERFQGTCYRAANWRCLGRSLGRGTKAKHDAPDTSVKELWAYPLSKRLREKLVAH